MRRLGYSLSLAGHALLLLIILNTRFQVTFQPEPARVVAVRIAEPPLPFFPDTAAVEIPPGSISPTAVSGGAGTRAASGMTRGASAWPPSAGPDLTLPGAGEFNLKNQASAGTFRLAPVGKSPEPWAIPSAPGPSPRPLRYRLNALRPGAAPGTTGGPGVVFLLPFDIRERMVADWTAAALDRIERNWIIPASARLAFAGRVQITLTIERQGGRRALVIDDSTLPEPLTLAALHAIEASLPLPPLPDPVAGELFTFTLVFNYNG
jgi:hypothetical protein